MRRTSIASICLLAAAAVAALCARGAHAQQAKPNILVIFGDDIGQTNVSAYSMGLMGYRTPNIDRIAREGMIFTDYYAEQSCTAGRSAFLTGQATFRTGLSKVGVPGSTLGLRTMKDVPYGRWREYDPADSIRFYALRLHEAKMIKSSPQRIIAQGTDWRYFNELKRELKG